jgi:hypothetical protein
MDARRRATKSQTKDDPVAVPTAVMLHRAGEDVEGPELSVQMTIVGHTGWI